MDSLYLLARTYWAHLLGFVLTFVGTWLVARFGPQTEIISAALLFGSPGYTLTVFGSEPWRHRERGSWCPVLIFVHWFGLMAFVIAALIPVLFSVAQYGWTQLNIQMFGILIVVALLTAARGGWEWTQRKH